MITKIIAKLTPFITSNALSCSACDAPPSVFPATERYPHSLPVTYLPDGYDAAIAGTSKDLKFTNTFSQPLLIQASASGGTLTVTLTLQ